MSSSIFAAVEMAPRDPILGLNEAFNADTRSTKVNLGVGVYFDDNGKIPLLAAVKTAEKARLEAAPPRGYQPIEGPVAYNSAVQNLLFGADSAIIRDGRVVTAQALGGTGALRIGADLIKRIVPDTTVYISDPSWENHRALFTNAGFTVDTYPYFDQSANGGLGGINFDGMLAKLKAGGGNYDVVVPSDSFIQIMVQEDLLQKFDKSKLPNLKNLAPTFQKLDFDPAHDYSVPYLWGTTGYSYDSAQVPGGKLDLAMQLILTPLIWKLVEQGRRIRNGTRG